MGAAAALWRRIDASEICEKIRLPAPPPPLRVIVVPKSFFRFSRFTTTRPPSLLIKSFPFSTGKKIITHKFDGINLFDILLSPLRRCW